jgi:Flp pilus assembly pilin Flp
MSSSIVASRRLRIEALRFLSDTRGATAIEYALLASGIGALLAATFVATGGTLRDLYQRVADAYPAQ